jgi:hypothetical protein
VQADSIHGEQRIHFGAKVWAACAYVCQHRAALVFGSAENFAEDAVYFAPLFRFHTAASPLMLRYNQSLAISHSR